MNASGVPDTRTVGYAKKAYGQPLVSLAFEHTHEGLKKCRSRMSVKTCQKRRAELTR